MSKGYNSAKSLFLISFFLFSHLSIAQVNFGVGAGVNFANIDQKIIIGSEKSAGFTIGVKINYQLNKKYSISLFPSFSEKGSVIPSYDTLGNRYEAVFDFKYIDLPITFVPQWKVGPVNLLPMIGINIGYLLSSHLSIPRWDSNPFISDVYNIREGEYLKFIPLQEPKANFWTLGLVGGLGTYIPVGSISLFVESRFTYDLTDAYTSASEFSSRINRKNWKFRNYYLSFTSGVLF